MQPIRVLKNQENVWVVKFRYVDVQTWFNLYIEMIDPPDSSVFGEFTHVQTTNQPVFWLSRLSPPRPPGTALPGVHGVHAPGARGGRRSRRSGGGVFAAPRSAERSALELSKHGVFGWFLGYICLSSTFRVLVGQSILHHLAYPHHP